MNFFELKKDLLFDVLQKEAWNGLNERFICITSDIIEKLNTELSAIYRLDIVKHFLLARFIAEEFPRIGYGMICASLTAYALNITNVNPLEHGLIFERGYSENAKYGYNVAFKAVGETKSLIINKLRNEFGKILIDCNSLYTTLSVCGTDIQLYEYDNGDMLAAIDKSTIAVFQEDYMRLLHYLGGYDYVEADYIRRIICKGKWTETEKYRNDFIGRCKGSRLQEDAGRLFDQIAAGVNAAVCKAFYVSERKVDDFLLPL